jgi:SAM-dependent methyltransferase
MVISNRNNEQYDLSVTRGVGILERFLAKKRSRMANSLIPDISRNGRILDIGCGAFPYFLVETRFKEKYGIDQAREFDRHRVALANSHPELHLQQWDFGTQTHLPFDDDFFDVVTMLAVFEHIEPRHLERLLSEIRRVLKPGGCYVMTTPAGWTDRLLRFMARLKLVSAVEIEDHKDTYSHHKVRRLLEAGGFQCKNIHLGHFELFMNIWGKAEAAVN